MTKNAEFLGEQHQVDEYFTPPDRDFTAERPVNEWLRLRTETRSGETRSGRTSEVSESLTSEVEEERIQEERTQSSINYKLWHRDPADGRSLYADEHESSVGDAAALREIFTAIKFRKLCTVDKVRKTWRYQISPDPSLQKRGTPPFAKGGGEGFIPGETYEIALDHEKTLGDFVEVELIGETTKDVATIRDEMLAFLHAHGISDPDADQVGYPYLLLFGDPNAPSTRR